MAKNEEITLKNTKAEILEALNEALKREKNMTKVKSDPVKEEQTKKEKEAINNTRENVEKNIFSNELINKFNELELAISTLENKLKELYGVEKELNNLTVIMNAGKDCIANIEEEKKLKKQELEDKIQKLDEEYKEKKEELEKNYTNQLNHIKLERKREEEEYSYNLKREREISNNKWQDEKAKREQELAIKEAETLKINKEAKEKEKYISDLEKKVEDIPKTLQNEYEKGVKDTKLELEKEHKYATELLKKDFQSTIDRQNDKIESLTEELKSVTNQNTLLQDKVDKAYLEIKELASKTVETTGAVKIIGNSNQETIR